jgi:exosortase/archaeosortase family protein
MKAFIKKTWAAATPYRGILIFFALLFFFHFAWKITVDNDGSDVSPLIMKIKRFFNIYAENQEFDRMYFLGRDVTPDWFYALEKWFTDVAAWFVRLFPGQGDLITDGILMYFPDPKIRIYIVWGCTGIKQISIFAGIMLFYPGPFLKKLWYIPFGAVILTIYNIIRIGSTSILTREHPERFDSLHDGILRYIYYTILFILWVIWAEYYEKRKAKS